MSADSKQEKSKEANLLASIQCVENSEDVCMFEACPVYGMHNKCRVEAYTQFITQVRQQPCKHLILEETSNNLQMEWF